MTQGLGTESPELRRALDRLQAVLEELSNRHRELKRERKQLRARVDELEAEREGHAANITEQLAAASSDRKRAIELEERVLQAEKQNAELHDRARELEKQLQERDLLIIEQEEALGTLRLQASEESKQQIASLQEERARLEEQQHQLVSKLDVATRDAGLARTRSAELERQLDEANARVEELRTRLRQVEATDDEQMSMQRAKLAGLSTDLSDALEMAATKEREAMESAQRLEDIRQKLVANEGEFTALRARCGELEAELEQRAQIASEVVEVGEEDRRQMIEQLQHAIRLIDKHLEGA